MFCPTENRINLRALAFSFCLSVDCKTGKQVNSRTCCRNSPPANNPIYVSQAPAAPPLPKTPYVSVDQLEEFSVSAVYDYMRISAREGLQEGENAKCYF